ncbi:hypothetical protein AT6N2_C2050 [Agrobacterium tumefaciens]|nr:hypothetical protein AT6N2_C2050 [Agrobacterium tumefaciens]
MAVDQHRYLRILEDFGRDAAEQHLDKAPAPVRGHGDEIAAGPVGDFDDRFIRPARAGKQRLAVYPHGGGMCLRVAEQMLGLFASVKFFFGNGGNVVDIARNHVKGLRYRHDGHLCACLPGEGEPLVDCDLRQRRAIGGNENVLEHDISPFHPRYKSALP